MKIEELIREFEFDCRVRKLSKGTIVNYGRSLRYLMRFLEGEYQVIFVERVEQKHIKQFLAMKDMENCKPQYINDLLKAYKVFFNYCVREEYETIKELPFDEKHGFIYSFSGEDGIHNRFANLDSDMYICCFCKNGDSLDMWRYYSNSKTGYSLGFNKTLINDAFQYDVHNKIQHKVYSYEMQEVIYSNKKKKDTIRSIISNTIKDLKRDNILSNETLQGIISLKIPKLRLLFKNECFASENEIRCIMIIPRKAKDISPMETYNIHYRSSHGLLIPYISVDLPIKTLRSVTVAPMAPNNAEEAVMDYLSDYIKNVKVLKSALPIRF